VISPALEIHPPHIVLGEAPWSDRASIERVFEVRTRFPDDCRVVVQDVLEPTGVLAELSVGDKSSRQLRVRLTERCPIGPIAANVCCTTRSAGETEGVVTLVKDVRGWVMGPVRAEPPTVLLDYGQSKSGRPVKVRIVPTGDLTVRSVEVIEVSHNLAPFVDCSRSADGTNGILLRGRPPEQLVDSVSDRLGAVLVAVGTDTEQYPLRIGVRLLAP
jgi:hypothetical protein